MCSPYPTLDSEDTASSQPSTETLLAIANYSLNDEAGRIEKLDGIEPKFYALAKYNIIAAAFIFAAEVNKGKADVFSFILVLPYSEMSEYLPRQALCGSRLQRLLNDHLIAPLKAHVSSLSLSPPLSLHLSALYVHVQQCMCSVSFGPRPQNGSVPLV